MKKVILPLEHLLGVGFGECYATKNNKRIWQEDTNSVDFCKDTLQVIEDMAVKEPNENWEYYENAPLYDVLYRRQKNGKWILVRSGRGFA